MLKMEEVSKGYQHRGQVVKALDGATVHIVKGDFVSVVGPSGSGKSTLLLMLGGMLSPSSGRVLLEDKSLYDLTSDGRARLRKENIGFVFQTFNLVPYLTAMENVQIPLYLAAGPARLEPVVGPLLEWRRARGFEVEYLALEELVASATLDPDDGLFVGERHPLRLVGGYRR